MSDQEISAQELIWDGGCFDDARHVALGLGLNSEPTEALLQEVERDLRDFGYAKDLNLTVVGSVRSELLALVARANADQAKDEHEDAQRAAEGVSPIARIYRWR